MHTGAQYHELIEGSRRARRTRARFQKLALSLLPARAGVLDFGAGTGIDAKAYAARGNLTFVYEPSEAMRAFLMHFCNAEISGGRIIVLDSPGRHPVHAVTANFAVLNHFADHAALFEELSKIIAPGGFVLASLLSPWYLGDARHRWWWSNLARLLRHGRYASNAESDIHRFTPRAIARSAAPHFQLERVVPAAPALLARLYMFVLLRRV